MQRDARSHVAGASRRSGDALTERLARAYGDALRVGDPSAAADLIDGALEAGLSAADIQTRVIAPAMRWIGELWERGALTIAQEHLATAVSHHVLTRVYPALLRQPRREDDIAVVAAVQGEHHVLGLRMVADVFEGAGFDVRFLGADVPCDALVSWVAQYRPAVVALGATMPLAAAMLARELAALRALDPDLALIVGGQGVPAALRKGTGVRYAASTKELAGFAADVLRTRPAGVWPGDLARGGVLPRQPGLVLGEVDADGALTDTTAASADAAREQARRAFSLEQLALHDPLTGLWNRRGFEDRHQELTSAQSGRVPALLMIDVDALKEINDALGQPEGDRALVRAARAIVAALRPTDFAARIGGDEFVVLLPGASNAAALRIGERIRATVAADSTEPRLTVSIGVGAPRRRPRARRSAAPTARCPGPRPTGATAWCRAREPAGAPERRPAARGLRAPRRPTRRPRAASRPASVTSTSRSTVTTSPATGPPGGPGAITTRATCWPGRWRTRAPARSTASSRSAGSGASSPSARSTSSAWPTTSSSRPWSSAPRASGRSASGRATACATAPSR